MNANQLQTFQDLHELSATDLNEDAGDWVMCDDVLDGTQSIEISHEGGEFSTLRDMQEEWVQRCAAWHRACILFALTKALTAMLTVLITEPGEITPSDGIRPLKASLQA